MNNDDIHSLSGAYAVDAVDDVERARFEAHLATCSACQAEVASLRSAAGELPSVTVTSPPPSLRTSVLRSISSVRPLPPALTSDEAQAPEPGTTPAHIDPSATPHSPSDPSATPTAPSSLESRRAGRSRRAPGRQWLAGVAAAAVLATGGLVWHPWSPGSGSVQLTASQQVLQAKDAQRFEKKVGAATATVVRSPSLRKAVLVTANMPAPPAGKVYELWLQQGTTLVPAGLVPAGQANTVLLEGDAASAQAVGITTEPAGGSDTPTLPPVALISFA
jgi:anti-sigma factor RsiW